MAKSNDKTRPAAAATQQAPQVPAVRQEAPPPAAVMDVEMFEADAGKGAEEVQASDISIPFLRIIQSNSPQIDRSSPKFVKEAKSGDMMLNVSNAILPPQLLVIPVYFDRMLIEWRSRNAGGGMVNRYLRTDPIQHTAKRNELNQNVLPNGNNLVDTAHHYIVVPRQDGVDEAFWAVMDMSSTKLKVSRAWNRLMESRVAYQGTRAVKTPTFAFQYLVETIGEKNAKGSFFNYKIEMPDAEDNQPDWMRGMLTDRNLYEACRAFYNKIREGSVKPQETEPGGGFDPDEAPSDANEY